MWAWWVILNHLQPIIMETLGSGDDRGKLKSTVIRPLNDRDKFWDICRANYIERTDTNLEGTGYSLLHTWDATIVDQNIVMWDMTIQAISKRAGNVGTPSDCSHVGTWAHLTMSSNFPRQLILIKKKKSTLWAKCNVPMNPFNAREICL